MLLERLLYVLAAQITGLLSPSNICGDLGLSQPTFDRYLSYLEACLPRLHPAQLLRPGGPPCRRGRKLYFVDGAIRNAALQRGLAPIDNPIELGALLEDLVAATLRWLSLHAGVRLYHWRQGRHEVDLIFDHPEQPLAFAIGSSPDHPRAGLQALTQRHADPGAGPTSWLHKWPSPIPTPRLAASAHRRSTSSSKSSGSLAEVALAKSLGVTR